MFESRFVDVLVGIAVSSYSFLIRAPKGILPDLIEGADPDPIDAPDVDVSFALVLMNDALHGMIAADPRLANVITHRFGNESLRDLKFFR